MTDNFTLSQEISQKIEELRLQFPKNAPRSLIIPALWMIQEKYGRILPEAMPALAQLLNVPEIWVKEAASWYSMMHTKKVGKYHIQLCHNLPCSLRGAEELLEYLKEKLKIQTGETTPDGMFTLSTVECLASCGAAPVIQINEKYYENMTKEKIDRILGDLK